MKPSLDPTTTFIIFHNKLMAIRQATLVDKKFSEKIESIRQGSGVSLYTRKVDFALIMADCSDIIRKSL